MSAGFRMVEIGPGYSQAMAEFEESSKIAINGHKAKRMSVNQLNVRRTALKTALADGERALNLVNNAIDAARETKS